MQNFSPKQLQDYLNQCDEAPLLLDVREHWEFVSKLDELDPIRDTILICHHGIRSRKMGYYMEQAGFSSITNLDGGVEQWARDVEPTMKRY